MADNTDQYSMPPGNSLVPAAARADATAPAEARADGTVWAWIGDTVDAIRSFFVDPPEEEEEEEEDDAGVQMEVPAHAGRAENLDHAQVDNVAPPVVREPAVQPPPFGGLRFDEYGRVLNTSDRMNEPCEKCSIDPRNSTTTFCPNHRPFAHPILSVALNVLVPEHINDSWPQTKYKVPCKVCRPIPAENPADWTLVCCTKHKHYRA